jgi:hypothetical protein
VFTQLETASQPQHPASITDRCPARSAATPTRRSGDEADNYLRGAAMDKSKTETPMLDSHELEVEDQQTSKED